MDSKEYKVKVTVEAWHDGELFGTLTKTVEIEAESPSMARKIAKAMTSDLSALNLKASAK